MSVKFLSQRQAIEGIVKQMVANESDVKTTEELDELGVKICLYCNQEDAAKIIGKEGQTINALRRIASVMGAKVKARFTVFLVEPWRTDEQNK